MSLGERTIRGAEAKSVAVSSSADSTAWLFPGLGSRFVGMGADIIGRYAAADAVIADAEQFLGYNISEVCLTGSGRKFVAPRIEAQVIYVINCAYADVLRRLDCCPRIVCGHSLGSWAAAYAAQAIDFRTGLELVTLVEDLLESHIADGEQAMGVVIGLSEEAVVDLCGEQLDVFLANINSPGQYVIAGRAAGVDAVLTHAKEWAAKKSQRIAGSRAMHTPLLADVDRELQQKLASFQFHCPVVPLIDGSTAQPLRTGDDIRRYFSTFLERPVHWNDAIRALGAQGCENYLEVGAAAVLTGMMPFIDADATIETVSDWLARLETTDEIDLTSPVSQTGSS